ncbi:MAG TPA: DUF4450 domain-containing protein [Candidatus Didemnitutus sp.]|nr:DUF4450 domain-containing protein [Candidatus Didemnitutus sp.]
MNILRLVQPGFVLVLAVNLSAQTPAASQLTPNLASNLERPLRYRPDDRDFVIENGREFFNRPLYGGNTAFRVDAGDEPEFVLYLPGRGGNLRFGVRSLTGAKWLHQVSSVIARYRPGMMFYEIRDPLLGPGVLRIAAVTSHQADGLVVRIESTDVPAGVDVVWAYGGVNGQRGRRDGDIGTENVPISEWFQLRPEFCADNAFELVDRSFLLRSKAATIVGQMPAGAHLALADAAQWDSCAGLLGSTGSRNATPVVTGWLNLKSAGTVFLGLQRVGGSAAAADLDTYREVGAPSAATPARLMPLIRAEQLPHYFSEAEAHFAALRDQLKVDTPDPYLNAAAAALNVAADAVWDEPQQAIMHGAIAWRTKLLGWRGPYALDALGWHDRARANLTYWAGRQNVTAVPDKLPPPDADTNLSRSEKALHSNGDLSNSHYDMNLVFIDGLFRHLLWTGDVELAKQMWPVIERHLAWERRLFRREFGPDKLPLYEAYAAIWASDDLQYSGGGTAHASAYNYWHNQMAAQIAPLVGADPAPYAREAGLIARGMRELLWSNGHFAESKDWLGSQLVHPSAGLWTFYHTMDSGLPGESEAASMAAEILGRTSIPVRGPGVPADAKYGMLPTTDWMPYTWSLNNVVMGENVHTALGLWQARRPAEAFTLLKSSLLASMFMGICPGNVGSMNYLDVYRRESQRDFADGAGVLSRAIVEGLFGVRPDALAGELRIVPGFPTEWNNASLFHPEVELMFSRREATDTFFIESHFARPMTLRLQILAVGEGFRITVNGQSAEGKRLASPTPHIEIVAPAAEKWKVQIVWNGGVESGYVPPKKSVEGASPDAPRPVGRPALQQAGGPAPRLDAEMVTIDLTTHFNDLVTEIFKPGKYLSPRSPFVSLALPSQGIGYWAGHVNATAEIDDTGLRGVAGKNGGHIVLPNGVSFTTPGPGTSPNILFVSRWDNYPREATVPLTGKAQALHLLMAGSTNAMQSRLGNGEVVVTYADGTTSRLALRNPETWWPIEQDYFTDDYQFRIDGPLPTRVDLKTGSVRVLNAATFKGQGRVVPGGAATVLELALDPAKELRSITVRSLANDAVIGLMAVTLTR